MSPSKIPSDADGPVFAEPWQGQAFALALQLQREGHVSAAEWADTLGAVLREAGHDDGSRYYDHLLQALERISIAKGLTDAAAVTARAADWEDAYHRTPHGQPVELRRASAAPL